MRALGALAEPNRQRIVELLRNGPLTVGEIAEQLGIRQPQTSKHLKVLSESGLVEVEAQANRRIYRLRSEPFAALDEWLHQITRSMSERFDNLDDYLVEIRSEDRSSPTDERSPKLADEREE